MLSLLLLLFSFLTLHLYEKPPDSLAIAAILQSINIDCLGDLDMPEYFLLQRLYSEFIMTLLSLPQFACSNKLHEKPHFIVLLIIITRFVVEEAVLIDLILFPYL